VTETRSFIVAPVHDDMSAAEIDRVFAEIAAAIPGLEAPPSVADAISANGAAVLQIPSGAVDTVKDMLGGRFHFDPQGALRLTGGRAPG